MRATSAILLGCLAFACLPLPAFAGPSDDAKGKDTAAESQQPLTAPNWPGTVDEVVADILNDLAAADREVVKSTAKADLIRFHHGWGTGIRNHYGLWRGNESLLRDACGGTACHPDDASMIIIEAVWDELQ